MEKWFHAIKANTRRSPVACGTAYERHAEYFLKKRGYRCIARQYRSPRGELDLVMAYQKAPQLTFVEVRFRAKNDFGSSLESITLAKQRRIICAAEYFLQCHPHYATYHLRFDVICFSRHARKNAKLDWIQNAFQVEW